MTKRYSNSSHLTPTLNKYKYSAHHAINTFTAPHSNTINVFYFRVWMKDEVKRELNSKDLNIIGEIDSTVVEQQRALQEVGVPHFKVSESFQYVICSICDDSTRAMRLIIKITVIEKARNSRCRSTET